MRKQLRINNSTRSHGALLGAAAIAMFLAGCSTLTGIDSNYPARWPPLAASSVGCPNLTGEYANGGSYSYSPLGGSHYLAYRLGMSVGTIRELDAIDTIRIHPIKDDEIIVEALASGTTLTSRRLSFKTKEVFCDRGAIAFASNTTTTADGFGVVVARSTVWLRQAVDHSIIGEEASASAAAALYFIPIAGTQTFWYRWDVR